MRSSALSWICLKLQSKKAAFYRIKTLPRFSRLSEVPAKAEPKPQLTAPEVKKPEPLLPDKTIGTSKPVDIPAKSEKKPSPAQSATTKPPEDEKKVTAKQDKQTPEQSKNEIAARQDKDSCSRLSRLLKFLSKLKRKSKFLLRKSLKKQG